MEIDKRILSIVDSFRLENNSKPQFAKKNQTWNLTPGRFIAVKVGIVRLQRILLTTK